MKLKDVTLSGLIEVIVILGFAFGLPLCFMVLILMNGGVF